jgi:hypothetical protein
MDDIEAFFFFVLICFCTRRLDFLKQEIGLLKCATVSLVRVSVTIIINTHARTVF